MSMKWCNVFPPVSEEFHERVEATLDALETQEIKTKNNQERVTNMRIEQETKPLGAKSLYITLAATAAAVMLMVLGGTYLLNSGIMLIEQPALSGGNGDYAPDAEIVELNAIAMTAKNSVSYFFLQEIDVYGNGLSKDLSGAINVTRYPDGRFSISGWDTDGGVDSFECSDFTDEDTPDFRFLTTMRGLFEGDEKLSAYNDQICSFTFIIADNTCTHAAFIPKMSETLNEGIFVVARTEDGNYTFSGIENGRLTGVLIVEFDASFEAGQVTRIGAMVGTAPAQDYPHIGELILGDRAELEQLQLPDGLISFSEALNITDNRVHEVALIEFGGGNYQTSYNYSEPVKDDDGRYYYKISGAVYNVNDWTEEDKLKFTEMFDTGLLDFDFEYLAVVDAVTGEIIQFRVD